MAGLETKAHRQFLPLKMHSAATGRHRELDVLRMSGWPYSVYQLYASVRICTVTLTYNLFGRCCIVMGLTGYAKVLPFEGPFAYLSAPIFRSAF